MKWLKDIYQDYFLMGNIYTPNMPNSEVGEFVAKHFNSITAENIMKPVLMQPNRGEFVFELSDEMMSYAKKHSLKVVGHTLAWHQQSINWIDVENTSKEEALAILRTHIEAVMGRYKGQIISWDVLNEAFEDGVQTDTRDWRSHLRDSKWLRMIGPDYVRHVFEIAHEVDPDTILYYNDYNLNYHTKAEATYYMVKELREAGVPIHGIGMQGHYHTNTPIHSVETSLELFSKLDGIEISFTELDVTATGAENHSVLSNEHEIVQGQYYAQLFRIFKKYQNIIKRVTFWGVDDASSWRSNRFPTLFNKDLTPKAAFYAVADPEKFLQEHPVDENKEPQVAKAPYGSPTLSNEVDGIWENAEPVHVNQQITAWEGATGTARVMWDEDHLYVLADVKVKALNSDASEIHNKDSIEIFIDQKNEREPFYQSADCRITVSFDNEVCFGASKPLEGFEAKTAITKNGYRVQAKIPLQEMAYAGRKLGFDLQINDSNERGVRQSIAKWNGVTENSFMSTDDWGILELKKHA